MQKATSILGTQPISGVGPLTLSRCRLHSWALSSTKLIPLPLPKVAHSTCLGEQNPRTKVLGVTELRGGYARNFLKIFADELLDKKDLETKLITTLRFVARGES